MMNDIVESILKAVSAGAASFTRDNNANGEDDS